MAITLSSDGYCELADVQARVQQFTLDANSKPTSTEAELFITDIFQEINAALMDAGYIVPVAQQGGSLQVTSGNITLEGAHQIGGNAIRLTGTGLKGKVVEGDFFIIDGSTLHSHMAVGQAFSSDDNEIFVPIAPGLMMDHADGVTVAYNATQTASQVLRHINALGGAVMVLQAAFSASGNATDDNPDLVRYKTMYDDLVKGIREGRRELAGATRRPATRLGNVRLLRV